MTECKCLQRPKFCDCDIAKLEARIAELEKDAEELAARRWNDFKGHRICRRWLRELNSFEWYCNSRRDYSYAGLCRKLGWKP